MVTIQPVCGHSLTVFYINVAVLGPWPGSSFVLLGSMTCDFSHFSHSPLRGGRVSSPPCLHCPLSSGAALRRYHAASAARVRNCPPGHAAPEPCRSTDPAHACKEDQTLDARLCGLDAFYMCKSISRSIRQYCMCIFLSVNDLTYFKLRATD